MTDESARWWTFTAFLTNFLSIYLLVRLYNAEGKGYFDVIHFSHETWKKDLAWFFGSSLIGLPIGALPMTVLAAALFGDAMIPTTMMFRPVPTWAFLLSFLFPLTIAFAELPTYFGYVMPGLEARLKNGWLAWLIASFFLGAQHMFLPLILDGRFIIMMAFGNVLTIRSLCRSCHQTPPDTFALLNDPSCIDGSLGCCRLFDDITPHLS